jgi:hypothetical protein
MIVIAEQKNNTCTYCAPPATNKLDEKVVAFMKKVFRQTSQQEMEEQI